jgi:hypothetical protein
VNIKKNASLRNSVTGVLFITYYLSIVCRMNHEVASCMLAYRAEFWSLLADYNMAAI